MMKKWMLLLALLLPLAAAGQDVSRKEYVYRADDAYCWEKCKIEVTAPMDGAEHPVIVWFHGGGLTGGHYATPKTLAESGHVVFSAGYRLVPQVSVAQIIDDAAAACRRIRRRPFQGLPCRSFRRRVPCQHAGARQALSGKVFD